MNRTPDFFRDEIRNGFYIPTAIKQSWAAQLDVLSEIDRICNKHGITYFADWGSFLGAVRHGGIIPWDDDVDICMKRDDYNRFRAVTDAELPENYCIHDYERQENHWLFLSRVVNNKKITFDEEYLKAHQNFPWLSGVDIFVKDYLYRDPAKEKERCDEIMYILAVAEGVINGNYNPASLKNSLASLAEKYSYSFPSAAPGRELAISLYRLAELLMARVPEGESDRICQIFPWGLKGNQGEPKEYYESVVRIPFEDTTIPVPACFNKVLRNRYGNYLEIRKGVAGHDYPSFEVQRKLFEESSGVRLPRFTFEKNMLLRPAANKSRSYKSLARECTDGLFSLYKEAVSAVKENDSSRLEQSLNDAQQLAADLGTTIEYARGENDPHTKAVVSVLEKLCEDIYNCYQAAINTGMSSNAVNAERISSISQMSDAAEIIIPASAYTDKATLILRPVEEDLHVLEDAINERLLTRREVLFLPVGAYEWKTLTPLYDELQNDPNVDVFIVPLPLMFKDYFGNVIMSDEEITAQLSAQKYPENLPIKPFYEYDAALHCPDQIFIQNPYDGENPCLTVPQAFYASNLLPFTDDLVYVPIGATSEFTEKDTIDQTVMQYYVTAPGVIRSDHVYVQSENIRTQYINALSSFAGEDSRVIWENKICPKPELFAPRHIHSASRKKDLLFLISIYEEAEHRDIFKAAITSRIATLAANSDKIHVTICSYPDAAIGPFVQEIAKENGIEIVSYPAGSPDAFVSKFDAYYGSSSPLVPVFAALKKPVMIADYEV